MKNVNTQIAELLEVSKNPKKSVNDYMSRTGNKAIGCFPVYTPEEIVYAAGMLPVGLWGGQTDAVEATKYLPSFCCSVMKANLENALTGVYDNLSAVISTTYCDTLKCIGEVWKAAVHNVKNITMVYPQNRKTEAGLTYLESEFKRVKGEMERISGKNISEDDLENAISVYNEYRATCREFTEIVPDYAGTITPSVRHGIIKAAFFMDKKDYTEKLKEIIAELKAKDPEKTGKRGVVITGLLAEPDAFLDLLDENNLYIAADDLVQESKQFRVDVPAGAEAPLYRMAKRISLMDGCSLLYDLERKRGENIINLVKKTDAQGVVICMLKFCDPEEFDYPIYKKEIEAADIPMLYLEVEQRIDSEEQLRTRIQTFTELLEIRN